MLINIIIDNIIAKIVEKCHMFLLHNMYIVNVMYIYIFMNRTETEDFSIY